MTDTPGQGPAEAHSEPQPEPQAEPQEQAPPGFGRPTPGSVAPDPPADPGYGRPGYGQPGYGQPSDPAASDRSAYGPPAYGPPAYGQPTHPQGYAPAGPAPLSPAEERTWGMLAHLSAILAGIFVVAFLGPLIVYVMQKDRSPFVRRHATESLNFQISLIIYCVVGGVAGVVLSLLTFGLFLVVLIPAAVIAAVAALVLIIMGCVAANDGREFRYPLTLRFVH
jgi:uncharacterized protein